MSLRDNSPLYQALQWHAQGQYRKAWTLYERLAQTEHQNPLYWLALTLWALQKGALHRVPHCLQHFQALAPTALQQWQYWHRLPLALWVEGLGHWRALDSDLLSAMDTHRPPAGIHPYFDFLLTLLLRPKTEATAAAQAVVAQALPTEPWQALAQAEAWCYLRHQQMQADPQDLTALMALLEREIAVQVQPVTKANALDLLARWGLIQGELAKAQQAFADAVDCDPTALRQLQHRLCHLPLSQWVSQWAHDGVNTLYQALHSQLQHFTAERQPIPIDQVVTEARNGVFTLFDWNYAHPQDARLRQLYSQCFVGWSAPETVASGGLGIVVTPGQEGMFFFSHQTLLAPLSHEVPVHLLVFAPHALWEDLKSQAPRLQIHYLSGEFGTSHAGAAFMQQWEAVREWGLQWIYYWEVGTDTLSFLIPYFRLAPVQFTSWGSVSSTGHVAIDYFLTTALLSPPGPDTEALFQEQCVYLPQLPVGFPASLLLRPSALPAPALASLAESGADVGARCRVGCLHTPRKNSPAFLMTLKTILTRHRQQHPHIAVEIVMIESPNPRWQKVLATRVSELLGDEVKAITWLPRQAPADFLAQMQRMDFLLDAFPFGGGKLAYDSLLCGVPMVSLRGDQLRGRIPFAFYTELGIYDARFGAATSVEAYIDQACALLHQPALRAHIRQRILQRREGLVHRALTPDFLKALQTMKTPSALP